MAKKKEENKKEEVKKSEKKEESKKEEVGITVKKDEDFSEWYTQVIQKADLADYTSVSGCIVFKPNSYLIWEKIQRIIDAEFKKVGIKNAYFPMFIPEKLLAKESTHFAGFTPEVAWVTHAGETKLAEKLAVRPTSETIMYDSYSKWIRSWRDLPLRLNQWNNVVRWEFKNPVPFMRTREFLWNEGHTVFATKEEAEAERDVILGIYSNFMKDYMALPHFIGYKTEKEKFAGAEYTATCELFMPNGRAIQGPDFHHDGQNFSKAYDIKFINKDEKVEYAWQNTWAITTRMLGVMIVMHSDDKGLVLPPKLAVNQVVIVPIIFEKNKKEVISKAKELAEQLKDFNPILDDREEYTPGWKYHDWELKGIPLRIEIGPKDIEKSQVMVARRDTGKKEAVPIKDIKKKIPIMLEDMQKALYAKAKKFLDDNTVETESWKEVVEAINNKKLVKTIWCGDTECEDWMKDKAGGAKILNMPFDQPSLKGKKCAQCGKPAKHTIYFAKSY